MVSRFLVRSEDVLYYYYSGIVFEKGIQGLEAGGLLTICLNRKYVSYGSLKCKHAL